VAQRSNLSGSKELRGALRQSSGGIAAVMVFSCVCNALMLTGPLYMMQVYDRVLAGRSVETLVALSVLACGMFAAMGVLDAIRGRIMIRLGAAFQDGLDLRVFRASLRRLSQSPDDPQAAAGPRDLEAVQRAFASPAMLAVFDIPWTPVFAALIFLFHPALGALALAGGVVLVAVTLLNRWMSASGLSDATRLGADAERQSQVMMAESEAVRALGMTGAAFTRWHKVRRLALIHAAAASGLTGGFASVTRTLRLFLQSAMLGLGAWLVLEQAIGAGVMIAASILMGRALAPVEAIIGNWATLTRAREGWQRLSVFLSNEPRHPPALALPRPAARLEVESITVLPPGGTRPVLRGVGFVLEPGQALGVIGPSGAGKSSLARAVTGLWAAQAGHIRLGGAALHQYDPDTLGSHLGYLPQRVTLFDGTVAENIARLDEPDAPRVIDAARRAAAHEMILSLPQGYDTRVSALGSQLSGGQIQRIGLARALYGNPVLLVLDEPNAALDAEGTEALRRALIDHKARGGSALIVAHRPSAIQECDTLLVLEEGIRRAFGPRDAILRQMVRNHTEIIRDTGAA